MTWVNGGVVSRNEDEQIAMVKNITQNEKWLFEGARFTASKVDGRLARCDTIINLDLSRFICLYRVIKRGFRTAKRLDLPEMERQPFDLELLKYVLHDYPKKRKQREAVFELARQKGSKVIIMKSRKAVEKLLNNCI